MNCCGNNLKGLVKKVAEINKELGIDYDCKVCEECGELITALMQTKTKNNDCHYFEVRNEMADVITTILVWMYNFTGNVYINIIDDMVHDKLIRTINRYNKEE